MYKFWQKVVAILSVMSHSNDGVVTAVSDTTVFVNHEI
jgi:hypothetical protein